MKESINLQEIGRIMDVSTVRTDVTFTEVKQMLDIVKNITVFVQAQCRVLLNIRLIS